MLVHQPLRLAHARLWTAGDDLKRHQIANAPFDEPCSVLGEGAQDVALGDDSTRARPVASVTDMAPDRGGSSEQKIHRETIRNCLRL